MPMILKAMATISTITTFPKKSEFERGVLLYIEMDLPYSQSLSSYSSGNII
jgi:hypothetical protein